jgi:hypothetical protein
MRSVLALALLGWLGCAWSLRLSMSTTDIKPRTTIKVPPPPLVPVNLVPHTHWPSHSLSTYSYSLVSNSLSLLPHLPPSTTKIASDTDFPLVARFLSEAMYGPEVPNGQRKELARLELIDLRDRYGSTVGKRKFPAALIVAEEDEEVVGCVGLDCQLFDQKVHTPT